jgi:hypothetical protein
MKGRVEKRVVLVCDARIGYFIHFCDLLALA